ncbi:PAS domain S-box protein [Sporomusa aerivorans]|uniref:PAS domain S-box protein n=1 Tax=Sporomusa aerivorans TaxID=204936 RepID=UPI00352A0983
MNQELNTELNEIITLINHVLQRRGIPAELTGHFQQYPSLEKLVKELEALCEFAVALSAGDLSQTLQMRGYFPGALKALQSNLRHLAWQTSMVAAGDYSQRVDFMGDFSQSFNTMIVRLQTVTENEQRYIAELEKSQAATAESERKYRLIAENTGDVIWLMDEAMEIRYMSPSIEKLLGYTPEEFLGKAVNATPLPFLQDVFQKAGALLTGTDASNQSLVLESEQARKNKKIIWTESLVTVVRNNAGAFIGFLGVTRDISERKNSENLLQQAYERRRKSEFFNQLASSVQSNDAGIFDLAWQNKISIPKDFSLFLLAISNLDTQADADGNLHRKQQMLDVVVDFLSRKEHTVAWENVKGIGVINSALAGAGRKDKELGLAREYLKDISLYFPNLQVRIGIANYAAGWSFFSNRLDNAEASLRISEKVWPAQMICHYEDCGLYRVLAPFAGSRDAGDYVGKLLGPLIEHDQTDGTDLLATLEKILTGLSFKEIGAQMYLHHKTIQLRKQRIEQILNLSLDSHETRMALATAIQLQKIIG